MSRVKKQPAKKATFGERYICDMMNFTIQDLREHPGWLKYAEPIDRAIAAAVRKERREIVKELRRVPRGKMIAKEMRAWEQAERMVRERAKS